MNARHGAKDAPGRVNGALAREPFLITGALAAIDCAAIPDWELEEGDCDRSRDRSVDARER